MADKQEELPAGATTRYDLDAKWNACLDLTLRRFVYSSAAGALGGFVFFHMKPYDIYWLFLYGIRGICLFDIVVSLPSDRGSPVTRWASVAFGAGVGIGSAYAECTQRFGTASILLEPLYASLPSE